jgi:hypothetical protein
VCNAANDQSRCRTWHDTVLTDVVSSVSCVDVVNVLCEAVEDSPSPSPRVYVLSSEVRLCVVVLLGKCWLDSSHRAASWWRSTSIASSTDLIQADKLLYVVHSHCSRVLDVNKYSWQGRIMVGFIAYWS